MGHTLQRWDNPLGRALRLGCWDAAVQTYVPSLQGGYILSRASILPCTFAKEPCTVDVKTLCHTFLHMLCSYMISIPQAAMPKQHTLIACCPQCTRQASILCQRLGKVGAGAKPQQRATTARRESHREKLMAAGFSIQCVSGGTVLLMPKKVKFSRYIDLGSPRALQMRLWPQAATQSTAQLQGNQQGVLMPHAAVAYAGLSILKNGKLLQSAELLVPHAVGMRMIPYRIYRRVRA